MTAGKKGWDYWWLLAKLTPSDQKIFTKDVSLCYKSYLLLALEIPYYTHMETKTHEVLSIVTR